MRGLEKNCMKRDRTDRQTIRLYDRVGPVGRFNENQCLSQTLGIFLHIDFISITRNVGLVDILNPEKGDTQN